MQYYIACGGTGGPDVGTWALFNTGDTIDTGDTCPFPESIMLGVDVRRGEVALKEGVRVFHLYIANTINPNPNKPRNANPNKTNG